MCPKDGTATLSLAGAGQTTLQPDQVIDGRYRVDRALGHGGFGTVWQAVHLGTRQRVALKVLHSDRSDEEVVVRRFLREARATAALNSPHIVRVLDVGLVDASTLFIALELLHGITLEQHLTDEDGQPRCIAETEAARLMMQVLSGLHEAHQQGLVHRDIKPTNVFLCHPPAGAQDGFLVKVVDFGIAAVHGSDLTDSASVVGSPQWMSPEQCQGLTVDGRSDLYAVAAVLFRCVAGKAPFDDAEPLTVMYRQVNEMPMSLGRVAQTPVSSQFSSVVARGLAKLPNDRYADALSMRQALAAVVGKDSGFAATSSVPPADGAATAEAELEQAFAPTPAWMTFVPSPAAVPPARVEADLSSPSERGNIPAFLAISLAILAVFVWLALEHSGS